MKANIAVFFSILFMCPITAPSILVVVNDNTSKYIIIDSSNEENRGNESINILDIEMFHFQDIYQSSRIYIQNASTHFYSKIYSSLDPSQNYPPPEVLS